MPRDSRYAKLAGYSSWNATLKLDTDRTSRVVHPARVRGMMHPIQAFLLFGHTLSWLQSKAEGEGGSMIRLGWSSLHLENVLRHTSEHSVNPPAYPVWDVMSVHLILIVYE